MKKKLKLKKSGLYIILLFISVITFNFSFKLPKKITPIKMDWNNYPKELTYIFNYNNYVKTKEEIPIYDENIKVIGTINKNVDLELDNVFLNNNIIYKPLFLSFNFFFIKSPSNYIIHYIN